MSERIFEAKQVYIDYLCDECERPMKSTGMVLTSSPQQYGGSRG